MISSNSMYWYINLLMSSEYNNIKFTNDMNDVAQSTNMIDDWNNWIDPRDERSVPQDKRNSVTDKNDKGSGKDGPLDAPLVGSGVLQKGEPVPLTGHTHREPDKISRTLNHI